RIEEITAGAVNLVRRRAAALVAIHRIEQPAAGRHVPTGVDTGNDVGPKAREVCGARQKAADADDGDGGEGNGHSVTCTYKETPFRREASATRRALVKAIPS